MRSISPGSLRQVPRLAGMLLLLCSCSAARAAIVRHYVLSDAAAGPDGAVWFTEESANRIGRISPEGEISEFPVPTPDSHPHSIALGSDGNLWFTERFAGKIGRITPLGIITEYPIPAGNSNPGAIASGPDGNLWFAIDARSVLGRLTPSGVYSEFRVAAPPFALTSGLDGNIWFVAGYLVGRITPAGDATYFAWSSADGQPIAICAGPDANLWLGTQYTGMIGRIGLTGSMTVLPPPEPQHYNQMNGVTPGPDGNVWYLRLTLVPPQVLSVVGRVTPSGDMTEFEASAGRQIVAGPNGNLWFTVADGVCELVVASVPPAPPAPPPPIPVLSPLALLSFGALLSLTGAAFLFRWRDGA